MPRPLTLPEPWRSLCEELERRWFAAHPGQTRSPGGVTLAAEACRCTPRTLNRWARRETTPNPRDLVLVESVFRDCGLEPPSA